MLTFLDTEPDVLAVRVEGRFGRIDLDAYLDRLTEALERNEKTHLFAEVADFRGIDLRDIIDSVGRWIPLLGKLEKFGRVAIVSDASWLRWAARVESALLPYVSYETFRLEEREIALAWIRGERDEPPAPALTLIETGDPDVLGFALDGKITAAEIQLIRKRFQGAVGGGRPLRLLGRIKHVGGIALDGLDAGLIGLKRDLFERLERYALVGGPAWLDSWVQLLDPVAKPQIRHFPAEDEAAAWAWLGIQPANDRRVA